MIPTFPEQKYRSQILCDLNKCTINEFIWFKTDQGRPQSGFMLTSSARDCTFR